jgi:hypothetical protein
MQLTNGLEPSPRPILVPGGGARSARGRLDDDPEELVVVHDRSSGLHAAVSIQSTVLGPALGGCRFHPYDTMVEAVDDAVRLGRAMTAKASLAGLDLGGGKAVIVGDPTVDRTEPLMRGFARLVDQLEGRYITAEDVGTTTADMDLVGTGPATSWAGRRQAGSRGPEADTAAGWSWRCGPIGHLDDTPARPISPTGGSWSPGSARWAGRWYASSWPPAPGRGQRRRRHGRGIDAGEVPVEVVEPDRAVDQACDVFAPCALGGSSERRRSSPPLPRSWVGQQPARRTGRCRATGRTGIVYAGLRRQRRWADPRGRRAPRLRRRPGGACLARIGDTLQALFDEAARDGITPSLAADRLARRRIDARLAGSTRLRRPDRAHVAVSSPSKRRPSSAAAMRGRVRTR